jgi:hypothetical protein
MKKSLGEVFNGEKGMQLGLSAVWDNVKRSISSKENSTSYIKTDPVTQKEVIGVSPTIPTNVGLINELVNRQVVDQELNGGFPTGREGEALRAKMRADAEDLVARESSFNLPKALSNMYIVATNYKHKAIMEDQIRLTSEILRRSSEHKFYTHGNHVLDQNNNPQFRDDGKDFQHIQAALDFSIRSFYGLPQKQHINIGKNILSSKDKEAKIAYEKILVDNETAFKAEEIEETRYNEIEIEYTKKIEGLGRQTKGSRIVRRLMKYVQLKGMGWNWFSGFNNVGFGVMANYTAASDGRIYDMKNLNRGYSIVFNNFLRNNTLNVYSTPTAKKVRALTEYFNLENIMIDFMKGNRSKSSGLLKRLEPYQIQKHTEGAWEGYNEKAEWIGEGAEPDLAALIISTVMANHGNYNSEAAIRVDENVVGQAFAQFRRWAFEAFASRFEAEKTDHIRGIERKGRYRSGIGLLTRAKTKEGIDEMNLIQKTLFTTEQLVRKLMFKPTKFDDKFSEVDAANLRANLTELMFFNILLAVGITLKHFAGEEDDDKVKFLYYTLINSFMRIQMDLTFYINPMEAEILMRRPLPVASIVIDTKDWLDAAYRYLEGDDIIKSGIYANDSRLMRETFQMLPFGTQIYRTITAGQIIY